MVVKNPADALEKDLARFTLKGFRVDPIEHAVFDREGRIVREGKCDYMKGEFPSYHLKVDQVDIPGSRDYHAGDEIILIGQETRDARLVGTTSGRVATAYGNLADGTGTLFDQYGQPVSRAAPPPVTPMKRKPSDW